MSLLIFGMKLAVDVAVSLLIFGMKLAVDVAVSLLIVGINYWQCILS